MNETKGCKICCIFLIISLIALGVLGIYTYKKQHVAAPSESLDTEQDEPKHFITTPFDIKGLHIGDGIEELIKNKFIPEYDFHKEFFQKKINRGYFTCIRNLHPAISDYFILDCIEETESYLRKTWEAIYFSLEIVKELPEEIYFEFENGKLMKVRILFEDEYFSAVVEAATLKYGKPTNTSSQTLHNKLTGIESQNINYTYKNNVDNTTLFLSNHTTKGNSYYPQGLILLYSNTYIEAREKQSKPAEKDF